MPAPTSSARPWRAARSASARFSARFRGSTESAGVQDKLGAGRSSWLVWDDVLGNTAILVIEHLPVDADRLLCGLPPAEPLCLFWAALAEVIQ